MAQVEEIARELLTLKGLKGLWPAQQKAIEAGLLGTAMNFVIIAPTSAGKTLAAELAMLEALKQKKRVVYLLPMQALISEKVREFKYLTRKYRVSDKPPWAKADVAIATFESFYRTSLLNPAIAKGFGLAIVDEFHVLYDKLRGFNLEKAITMIRLNKIRIVCLSATFEDKSEVTGWLEAELVEIPEEMRQIQLKRIPLNLCGDSSPMEKVYQQILSGNMKPCLLFCNTRESARSRAVEFSRNLNEYENRDEIVDIFAEKLGRTEFTPLESNLIETLVRKTGFHHSGLHSEIRSLVEERFRAGHLDYLFATTGLAYGVNFPAKTVVICDLTFYDAERGRQVDVPVYLYIQMAGRAGRPQFGKDGYVVTVAKAPGDDQRIKKYDDLVLEKARSRIAYDDFFRKAILELVYSGRVTDEEIMQFFSATFFNYQAALPSGNALGTYDLKGLVKHHAQYLQKADFLRYMGRAGFTLTDLGKVTLDFLFRTYGQYELSPFQHLDKYLEETQEVRIGFDIIYKLAKEFPETNLARTGREKPRDIEEDFQRLGVTQLGGPEYTAYAIYWGWMGNLRDDAIEIDYKVYASQIPNVANELIKLLGVYETLAKKRNIRVSQEFQVLKDRLAHGVREEEVPFVKLEGIERDTVRNLYEFCHETLGRPPFEFKGTMLDILAQHSKKFGKKETINLLSGKVRNIGSVRARRIVSLISA